MKKYLLIGFIGLSYAVMHAHDAEHTPYHTTQMELGTITVLSIVSTYVGNKINRSLVDHAETKNEAYKREKFHKNFDYKLKPTFKAWCEKSRWILKNHVQNATRRVVCHGVGFCARIIPATLVITTSTTMVVRYINHLNCKDCYTNEKRA